MIMCVEEKKSNIRKIGIVIWDIIIYTHTYTHAHECVMMVCLITAPENNRNPSPKVWAQKIRILNGFRQINGNITFVYGRAKNKTKKILIILCGSTTTRDQNTNAIWYNVLF